MKLIKQLYNGKNGYSEKWRVVGFKYDTLYYRVDAWGEISWCYQYISPKGRKCGFVRLTDSMCDELSQQRHERKAVSPNEKE